MFEGVYKRQDKTNGNVVRHEDEIRALREADLETKHVTARTLTQIADLLPRLIEVETQAAQRREAVEKADAVRAAVKAERYRWVKIAQGTPTVLTQLVKAAVAVGIFGGAALAWLELS